MRLQKVRLHGVECKLECWNADSVAMSGHLQH